MNITMMNTKFLKTLLFLTITSFLISCDKDYTSTGTDLVGDGHYAFEPTSYSIQAATRKTGIMASNNLETNALGVYKNTVFGTTTANFVSQAQLASVAPTIDLTTEIVNSRAIDSVVLYIPYFVNSTVVTNTDGSHTYTLDSIYGDKSHKIDLGVYENKYFLAEKSISTNLQEKQDFYTDQDPIFDSNKGIKLNDDTNTNENTQFQFSEKEYKLTTAAVGTTAATTTYIAPGMRLHLNKAFFNSLLFQASSTTNLANNVNFMQAFKGLYFKSQQLGTNQVMALMNFAKGNITTYYHEATSTTDATKLNKSIVINLTGNTVNLFDETNTGSLGSYLDGDSDKLVLKGHSGAVAYLDISDATLTEIQNNVKNKHWLINEANLVFNIHTDMANADKEPNRIYLYDVNSKRPIADYSSDITTSNITNYAKSVYGGIIKKDANGKGLSYKIRVTNYIKNIVKNDSTIAQLRNSKTIGKLGLSVCQAIANSSMNKVKSVPAYSSWLVATPAERGLYYFPKNSVMNPLGTVLWGTGTNVAEDKKVKLQIYYTKPE
ncbi:DUF4270 domain-containing protein [Flavobacterium branchiophilum]|uniref:Lipoprotein n=1 Tax=Flavobacterium branchiophilum TaxID=55197 RepID=A0A2H3KA34_9FLAO|nr:DUF4270 domain-containing protein [Flavobacterium branchiophilum]PDS23287.1 hypothetical protein B0A77_11155 [Flavobacterium branchiophilum]